MAFISCGRLGTKSVLANLSRLPTLLSTAQYAQAAAGAPKLTFKKYEPPIQEHYDVKNARLSRPLSPHLTIYQPQLTSMMLTGYATVLGVGALVSPHDVSHYVTMVEGLNLSPVTLILIKAILASPFAYHFVNGLRHLYWDTAKGLSIKEVYSTGYAMLAGTLVMTLILAAL
ncbi:hypothetical protein MSG28_009562 [Choristoneura fumiferana]|uniref:Uncharacterized protein n=1 Tax=Choristoneura fumiferana TaxID=7141 RepID=A0ACC0JBQ6_CHOFU|nr:hypothetical protein MSG28_009562 [Choristoneura fumiferana]